MSDSRAHILVVEDAEEVRELLVLLLESDGLSVSSCGDADQAFQMVQRERPDLILTDLMLGSSSGLDLITRIRSDLAPPVPPIVACSGFTNFEDEALRRGAAAFIPKPFEAIMIQKTVTAILGRHEVADSEREEAVAQSRALRAKAIEAASAAVLRLASRREDLAKRAGWMSEFLPRYFGFGEAFVTMFQGNQLQVRASSDQRAWRRGQAIDLAVCRDIIETSSALVVPDLLSLGVPIPGPHGRALRFFAGVPLSSGPVAVGTLCFVDEEPRRLGSDGFSVIEALARRASALLSAREWESAPLWLPSGLMSREGLCVLLTAELSRMEREAISLSLFAFAGQAPNAQVHEHSAMAELGEGHLAAFFAYDGRTEARRAMLDFVGQAAHTRAFGGGGLISIEGGGQTSFDAQGLLRVAEGLLESALRRAPGGIERIVVRREPLGNGTVESEDTMTHARRG